MPRPTGSTNPILQNLINDLRERGYKENSKFLIEISRLLSKPTRIRAEVNVSKLQRYLDEGETAIVPGKVLSAGILEKKVKVVAWNFSEAAMKKIEKAGGKCMSIEKFVKENPKGSGVRIIC